MALLPIMAVGVHIQSALKFSKDLFSLSYILNTKRVPVEVIKIKAY